MIASNSPSLHYPVGFGACLAIFSGLDLLKSKKPFVEFCINNNSNILDFIIRIYETYLKFIYNLNSILNYINLRFFEF